MTELQVAPATPEQAIAATLGGDELPYDELLRCLENDWHISARWDGLRKFWCIELTEEGVRLRDAELGSGTCEMVTSGTLTAEQVREAVISADRWEKPMGNTGLTNTHLIIRDDGWQAIADELNAELGGGTCEYVIEDNMNESEGMGDVWFRCTNCCTCYDYYADDWLLKMPHCPKCGAVVEGVR